MLVNKLERLIILGTRLKQEVTLEKQNNFEIIGTYFFNFLDDRFQKCYVLSKIRLNFVTTHQSILEFISLIQYTSKQSKKQHKN